MASSSSPIGYHPTYDSNDGKLFTSRIHDGCYNGNLSTINQILDDCAVRVNFWGTRQVVSKSGVEMPIVPLALETIATRTLSALTPTLPIDELDDGKEGYVSPQDLRLKFQICKKLIQFYSTSHSQVLANPITKLFNRIKEYFSSNNWVPYYECKVLGRTIPTNVYMPMDEQLAEHNRRLERLNLN